MHFLYNRNMVMSTMHVHVQHVRLRGKILTVVTSVMRSVASKCPPQFPAAYRLQYALLPFPHAIFLP